MARSKRYAEPFTICLWDIDHSKQINDTYGHATGDHVLCQMTQVARSQIRVADTVGRWGGEECFLLLLHTRWPEVRRLVKRLRHDIMIVIGNRPITAGFGLAEYGKMMIWLAGWRELTKPYTQPNPPGAIECV